MPRSRSPHAAGWPNEIHEILDGYYDKGASLSHAVQKDAIQNGWDARLVKKGKNQGKNWKFTFELIENQGLNLLVMTDEGTSGLTGKVYSGDDMDHTLWRAIGPTAAAESERREAFKFPEPW